MGQVKLGVNIDHVATLRQARMTRYPDPVQAVFEAEQGGADGITLHLREDRRHIQERDVELIKRTMQTPMNLEMAMTDEMLRIAEKVRPENCCLVPESREELTTEGGLDVAGQSTQAKKACQRLCDAGVMVSLFIDPDVQQIDAAVEAGAPVIELHTGHFSEASHPHEYNTRLSGIIDATEYALSRGLQVNAGHGLHYHNVMDIAEIPGMTELNIGHSIISHALFVGLKQAVCEMKSLMNR